jgi:hypothetical protein
LHRACFKGESKKTPEPTGERGWRYCDGSEASNRFAFSLSSSKLSRLFFSTRRIGGFD